MTVWLWSNLRGRSLGPEGPISTFAIDTPLHFDHQQKSPSTWQNSFSLLKYSLIVLQLSNTVVVLRHPKTQNRHRRGWARSKPHRPGSEEPDWTRLGLPQHRQGGGEQQRQQQQQQRPRGRPGRPRHSRARRADRPSSAGHCSRRCSRSRSCCRSSSPSSPPSPSSRDCSRSRACACARDSHHHHHHLHLLNLRQQQQQQHITH